jgi:hypothetical protein
VTGLTGARQPTRTGPTARAVVCGSWNKKKSAWRVTRRASAVTGARTRPALCRESPRNAAGPHYSAPRRKNSVSRWHPARPQEDSQPDQAQRASSQRRQACQAKHWQSPGDSPSLPRLKAGRVASCGAVGDKSSGEGGWRPTQACSQRSGRRPAFWLSRQAQRAGVRIEAHRVEDGHRRAHFTQARSRLPTFLEGQWACGSQQCFGPDSHQLSMPFDESVGHQGGMAKPPVFEDKQIEQLSRPQPPTATCPSAIRP